MHIPFFSLKRQWESLEGTIRPAIDSVLNSQYYIGGPAVTSFEEALSCYLEVKEVIGCNSGTDALWLALKALDLKPSQIVLTTPYSFVASSSEIAAHGGYPVFIDIDQKSFNLCPDKLESWLNEKASLTSQGAVHTETDLPIKGIVVVNIFGQCANYERIEAIAKKWQLWIVEDAAQSIGAHRSQRKSGTFGDITCFSFYPTKNLGAFGDGGAITTNSKDLADKIRILVAHGRIAPYVYGSYGINSRLDALQASILNQKLAHIDSFNESRRAIAQLYKQNLSSLSCIALPQEDSSYHVYHQYSIEVLNDPYGSTRDALRTHLGDNGIGTNIFYPQIFTDVAYLNTQPQLKSSCPVAQRFSKNMLQLPIWPELTAQEVGYICDKIIEFHTERTAWIPSSPTLKSHTQAP